MQYPSCWHGLACSLNRVEEWTARPSWLQSWLQASQGGWCDFWNVSELLAQTGQVHVVWSIASFCQFSPQERKEDIQEPQSLSTTMPAYTVTVCICSYSQLQLLQSLTHSLTMSCKYWAEMKNVSSTLLDHIHSCVVPLSNNRSHFTYIIVPNIFRPYDDLYT